MGRPAALETLWDEEVVAAVEWLTENRVQFTIEDVRERVTEPEPHHNAWGSIWNKAEVVPLVRSTGQYLRARRREARGHTVLLWERRPVRATVSGQ